MQILSLSILRLRRPYVAISSSPMHRLSPPSRFLLSYRACAPPRWWPSAIARRDASVMAAPNPPVHRVPRLPHGSRNMASVSGVKGEELAKPDRRRSIPSANDPIRASNDIRDSLGKHFPINRGMNNEENRRQIEDFIAVNAIYGDEDASSTTVEVTDGKQDPWEVTDGDRDARGPTEDFIALCSDGRPGDSEEENVTGQSASEVSDEEYSSWPEETFCPPDDGVPNFIPLPLSSHRDGSINRGTYHWRKHFRIADRTETRLEAMMLSNPIKCCILEHETCLVHSPCPMWQIFSLKLAKIPMDSVSVELYGYIAARDDLDSLLNYVVNISRDDPIIVEQGSLIEMTGPKRAIKLSGSLLIEYDMRIKIGDIEKDDLQLIDGAGPINELNTSSEPFTMRIYGDYGAIDMNQMSLYYAVEGTVEVGITEVQSSFDLCVTCFSSGVHDEIRLFDGVIGESRGLRRHVIAVVMGTCMDLKLKVGSGSYCSAEHYRSFKAMVHGCDSQQIKTEFASISVKVTWSTLRFSLN